MVNKKLTPTTKNSTPSTEVADNDPVGLEANIATLGLMSSQTAALYTPPKQNGEKVPFDEMALAASRSFERIEKNDLGTVECMLSTQLIALDALFNNLAERAHRAEYMSNLEVYLKLALKAQSQARCTAETLAFIKNPQPYIKQANIAQGHQQVNNNYAGEVAPQTHATESEITPSKLLGANNERMDTRAQSSTIRANQGVEAVGKKHGRKNS